MVGGGVTEKCVGNKLFLIPFCPIKVILKVILYQLDRGLSYLRRQVYLL